MTSIFWFLSILLYSSADYFPELQNLVDHYLYDPECVFNYSEVTSKNIKKFPACTTVYALLVINNNTDLTVAELKAGFKNVEMLIGGVLVENTTFTNISFFTTPKTDFPYVFFVVDYHGFIVRNNAELTNVDMLWSVYMYEKDDFSEPEFRIENNPKLDAKFLCDFGYLSFYSEIIVHKNLRDCACPGGIITSSTIDQYKDCESIFNGVKIYNFTDSFDLSPLYNVEYIRGPIDIQNTNLQNLSFLANVGDQKVNSHDEKPIIFINLQNNFEMKRLGFPMLMDIQNSWYTGIKLANFENLHPDFCLTIEEITFFLENRISFINLHAKICADNRTKIHNTVICHFLTMASLPEDCNLIMGDLIINPGDEEYFHKLENIRYLIGSIAMQNTSLEDMQMLTNLRYIVQLDDTYPVIQVVGNSKLESVGFWGVENIVTRNKRLAVFQYNIASKDVYACMFFNDMDDSGPKYRKTLNISGDDCGKKVQIEYRYPNDSGVNMINFFNLLLIFGFVVLNH